MDSSLTSARGPSARWSLRKVILIAVPALELLIPMQSRAQTALDTASVFTPGQSTPTGASLTIVKHAKDGGFVLTVTNKGPDAISGALVTDKVGKGRSCPAENAVIITGSGTPAGSFTIPNLSGSGIVLGTLNSGQSATLVYSCQAV